jgi:phenylalanyl-tRNA synthetase beta chain
MKVPVSWIREYVDVPWDSQELAHRLTMAGVEVSAVTEHGGSWDGVVVGKVISVDPHPNADRLQLATVDTGDQNTTVVCGAPNIQSGQKVAFAKLGTSLINPRTGDLQALERVKIRGVHSEGMVCSELELGLGEDHTGILVLEDSALVGMPLAHYKADTILELEVTPNRPDCLAVLGVAREVAAQVRGSAQEPDSTYSETGFPVEGQLEVRIEDPDLCSRYTASLITGVKVGPSPSWLQERLQRAGQRPINNVVDVTNYVMLEYGQPLHAFDYSTLSENTIVVRQAREGEVLDTLDGERRDLRPPMLVIADARRPVALAGIVGGVETEMTESTTTVLLESATFDPLNTRRTAALLKVRTEASSRFEKGLHPDLAERALRRATRLILEVTGGQAAKGIADVYPAKRELYPIRFRMERLKRVLGVTFSRETVLAVLSSFGFECQTAGSFTDESIDSIESPKGQRLSEADLLVTPPYWRTDVGLEEDLVEEVARIVGYDSVPIAMLSGVIPQHEIQPERVLREEIKDLLVSCGLQETISYSLVDKHTLENVGALSRGPEPLKVANPMTPAQEYLRTTLRGNILNTLAFNERVAREDGFRLFEVGRVYIPKEDELPHEKEMAVAVFSGHRYPSSWRTDRGTLDFFDAKETVQALLSRLGISVQYERHLDDLIHPDRCARIVAGDKQLGIVGEIKQNLRELFDIQSDRVAFFELDLDEVSRTLPTKRVGFQSIVRFPSALRDIAVLVDRDVPADKVSLIIGSHPLVTTAILFDIYEGRGIPGKKKSLAYHITFRSDERTLTTIEVDKAQQVILSLLAQEVSATLRGSPG